MFLKNIITCAFICIVFIDTSRGFILVKRSLIHGPRQQAKLASPVHNTCKVKPIEPTRLTTTTTKRPRTSKNDEGAVKSFQMETIPIGEDLTEPQNYEERLEKWMSERKDEPYDFNERIDSSWTAEMATRGSPSDPKLLWRTFTMPIQIDKGFNTKSRETILFALWALHLAMDKCFRFQIIPSDCKVPESAFKNFVFVKKISTPSINCQSALGMVGGKQTIEMRHNCHEWAIAHEFMHTLGFYHEQVRPDRDRYIKIDFALMDKDKKDGNFKSQYQIPGKNQKLWVSEYDFDSLMHYPLNKYMTAKVSVPEGVTVGHGSHFSKWDIQRLRRAYNCNSTNAH